MKQNALLLPQLARGLGHLIQQRTSWWKQRINLRKGGKSRTHSPPILVSFSSNFRININSPLDTVPSQDRDLPLLKENLSPAPLAMRLSAARAELRLLRSGSKAHASGSVSRSCGSKGGCSRCRRLEFQNENLVEQIGKLRRRERYCAYVANKEKLSLAMDATPQGRKRGGKGTRVKGVDVV